MKTFVSLLKRKKAALCILAGLCSVSLFVIVASGEKINTVKGGSYVVKIKHYGHDAAEMERSVTIPLEDALSAISGIMTMQSSSENSLSRVFVRFKPGEKGRYEAVRDAAQRVYETLPTSAQRPEILSSDNSRVPVWSAAVFGFSEDENDSFIVSQMLEKIVKPKMESLEGAGEVIVSGSGLKEIVIILDQEKLEMLGLDPNTAAMTLGLNDFIFSGGTIVHQNREIILSVDGRFPSGASALEKALIPLGEGRFAELSEIALVTEQERTPDILSRLNGKKTAGLAVMGRHDADLRKLSGEIKKELSSLDLPLEFIVLSDLGAEEAAAFRSVLNAALLGATMTAFITFLLGGKNTSRRFGIFCALSIPFICLVSAAVLSIAGFSINRLMLAGIAAGVGTAVDAVILCSEKLRKCVTYSKASAALSELAGPLIAGAATTVAALIPLTLLEDSSAKIIASAIAVVCITALLMSLSFLPPLLLWDINYCKKPVERKFKILKIQFQSAKKRLFRVLCRLLAADVKFCLRSPQIAAGISFILTISAIFALFVQGVDTSIYTSEDSVYAQIEFDGGLLAEEADRLLAAYGEKLASNAGIKNVETGARTGSGSLLVSFDPKQIQAHAVRELAKQTPIPEGFVFFPENSNRDRYWEIRIYGDEDQKCREIAQELAFLSETHPIVKDRVLNFKPGSKKLILMPDRELFAETGISFSNAASRARTGVYGPVAYKRINSSGETDVRIRTGTANNVSRQTRDGALETLIAGVRLGSLVQTKEETEPASIRRTDRRRTASITISTGPIDPRRVKKDLEGIFSQLDLPPGYSVEFDPEAIRQAQVLSATVLSFVMAVFFCYMIIASINESFTLPLLILSAIPPSLAIPALGLALFGSAYNSAVACAFIAVSGMTVNAAVLCVDGLRAKIQTKHDFSALNIYSALRRKMPALLATTATTAAGAVPFLFLAEGANTLIRTLSIVSALGVLCSFICSITVLPSLFVLFKKKLFLTHIKNISLVRNKKT